MHNLWDLELIGWSRGGRRRTHGDFLHHCSARTCTRLSEGLWVCRFGTGKVRVFENLEGALHVGHTE